MYDEPICGQLFDCTNPQETTVLRRENNYAMSTL